MAVDPLTLLLLGLGGSLVGALGGQQQPDLRTVSTLTPEQQRIASQLAQLIGSNVGRPLEAYQGQLSAAVPGALGRAQATVADLLGGGPGLGAMPTYMSSPFAAQTVQPALSRMLAGEPVFQVDVGATQRAIEAAQAPALRQFREEVLPATREQFVGGGAFWSRARQEAETRAAERLAESLAAQRAQGTLQDIEAQRQAALTGAQIAAQAAPVAAQFALQSAMQPFQAAMMAREQAFREAQGATGTQLEAARALAGMAGQQYGMEQDALTRAYQEWLRTRPESSPYLQAAFSFLGIPMLAAYQPPFQPSPWAQAAGVFGNLFGSWLAGGAPGLSRLLAAA